MRCKNVYKLILSIFLKDEILADPSHWGTAWTGLRHMSYSTTLATDLHVLDFYLVSEWMERKGRSLQEPLRLVYVDMKTVADIVSGGGPISSYERIYTVSALSNALVFLIVEKYPDFEYPFIMALNIPDNTALVLTINEEQHRRPIQESQWFYRLWSGMARLRHPESENRMSPVITYAHWITVRSPPTNPTQFGSTIAENRRFWLEMRLYFPRHS